MLIKFFNVAYIQDILNCSKWTHQISFSWKQVLICIGENSLIIDCHI